MHLLFCARLYREQIGQGRYFLHEHPKSACSWQEKCMKSLINDPLVMRTEIDQCAYGLVSKDELGEGPARKPTSFLTNSVAMANVLSKKCGGCERHVQLVEGRARAAQEYPRGLCRAVTKGIIEQARLDASDAFVVECKDPIVSLFDDDFEDFIGSLETDNSDGEGRYFWDDTSGEVLNPTLT